jgi:hypothetical protein
MKSKPATPKLPAILQITSAAQLQQLVEVTVPCVFKLDTQTVSLPVGRMTAHTFEKVRALRRKAVPKWNDKRKAYDEYDPVYLEEIAKHEKWCRSFIIYSHCPLIAAEKPGLTNEEEIHQHVSKFFTEHILELISLTIQAGGLERVERIEERVGFTSPPASES